MGVTTRGGKPTQPVVSSNVVKNWPCTVAGCEKVCISSAGRAAHVRHCPKLPKDNTPTVEELRGKIDEQENELQRLGAENKDLKLIHSPWLDMHLRHPQKQPVENHRLSKRLAIETLDHLPTTELDKLIIEMQRLGIIPNAELPGGLDGDKLKAFAPGLLLSAWITRIMYTEILVNPFWFLDHLLAVLAPAESYSMAAGMHHLFQELENLKAGDCKDVHTCRQDFMAFLDPDDPTLPKSTESRDFSQHVEEALKAATEEVAGKIVETSAVLLKDPGSEKLRTALNYMTLQTAERGYQIAQSRACLRISYINELPPDFKGTEGNMRRHDSHRIYLSEKPEGGYLHVEDETRLIGKPVLLVVEPLITARGYSSKVNYDVEHVMNPAFVWLGEEYTTIE